MFLFNSYLAGVIAAGISAAAGMSTVHAGDATPPSLAALLREEQATPVERLSHLSGLAALQAEAAPRSCPSRAPWAGGALLVGAAGWTLRRRVQT